MPSRSIQSDQKVRSEVVNWRTVGTALLFALVGVVALWLSGGKWAQTGDGTPHQGAAVVAQVGGLLIATGALTAAWELIGRRSFAREVYATARLSEEVVQAGIQRVTMNFRELETWDELFRNSNNLDLVVGYGRTWRNSHIGRLTALAERGRLRVYLPDPDDPQTVAVFAARFRRDDTTMEADIREAIQAFAGIDPSVQVRVRAGDFTSTMYRFDGKAVLALYSHTGQRQFPVPTFVVEGGGLTAFVDQELGAIHAESRLVAGPEDA